MKDKLLTKSKFPWMLGLSALLIASCAAFFSVYGIATLFAGATISAMVMASSLEIGKLVSTTFLYRYWSKCTIFLKSYLVMAILILMIITSLGIFGYLSAAFQKSSIEFNITQEKIVSMQDQKSYFHDKMDASKKRIDDLIKIRTSQESRMTTVLTNEYISRNPVQLKQLQQQNVDLINDTDKSIKDETAKIQESIDGVGKIDGQINDLKLGSAEKKDVQIFKFVADAINLPLDTVARWFILSIIFVFDPLAICLILAYNVAVYKKEDESVYDDTTITNIPTITPPVPQIQPEPIVVIPTSPVVEPQKHSEPIPVIEPIVVETPSVEPKNKNNMDDFFRKMFKIST